MTLAQAKTKFTALLNEIGEDLSYDDWATFLEWTTGEIEGIDEDDPDAELEDAVDGEDYFDRYDDE